MRVFLRSISAMLPILCSKKSKYTTDDKWAEKEIRKTSPFIIATNSRKYLGVTLTKQVKDLYDKNFKSLKKEIEEDTRK